MRLAVFLLWLGCARVGLAAPPEPIYVSIPPGEFLSVLSAGSAKNSPIAVKAFAMRSTPVTIEQFLRFTQANPQWGPKNVPAVFADSSYLSQFKEAPDASSMADQPITQVSWFAAEAYCESEGASLPTWYEWEYVAAADATHADARNNAAWRSKILGWYARPSTDAPPSVGGDANYYGVHNMHGLIWEWVDDFNALLVSADSRNQGDPEQLQYCGAGAISLQDRDNFAVLMRVALLSSLNGADSTKNLGFRCARH